jgi:hypothetical protein
LVWIVGFFGSDGGAEFLSILRIQAREKESDQLRRGAEHFGASFGDVAAGLVKALFFMSLRF